MLKHEYNRFLSFEGTLKNKKYICEHKYTKSDTFTKVTQKYVFSKIATFETLSAMPHFQNSIGNLPFLSVFGNSKSDWNIKIA